MYNLVYEKQNIPNVGTTAHQHRSTLTRRIYERHVPAEYIIQNLQDRKKKKKNFLFHSFTADFQKTKNVYQNAKALSLYLFIYLFIWYFII